MGIKIKLRKLDRRHTGYDHFQYMIDFSGGTVSTIDDFYQLREWCWETWGSSKELTNWLFIKTSTAGTGKRYCQNEHWCWQNDTYATRIYLRTEAECSHFILRWM